MHAGEVIIPIAFFGVLFGIFYLYISSRNKERLALIEKGSDATIFNLGKRGSSWKVIVINLACLIIGIGVGALVGSIIEEYTTLNDGAIVGVVFIMAGLGLYAGYTQTRKALDQE